jgi:hypothetical protein
MGLDRNNRPCHVQQELRTAKHKRFGVKWNRIGGIMGNKQHHSIWGSQKANVQLNVVDNDVHPVHVQHGMALSRETCCSARWWVRGLKEIDNGQITYHKTVRKATSKTQQGRESREVQIPKVRHWRMD